MSPLNKETFVVWFNTSNKYVFLDNALKDLFQLYFKFENKDAFIAYTKKQLGIDYELAENYYSEISTFLEECNTPKDKPEISSSRSLNASETKIKKTYILDHLTVTINYSSEKILNFIHHQISHLNVKSPSLSDHIIDIQEDSNYFYLYLNTVFVESFFKKEYHLLQGKLALIILNLVYSKQEHDWLAMLHASTVCNEKEAILFVGESGNGKSTFTALMVAHGYTLVSDDITPILSKNFEAFFVPSAISIKEGSFKVLKPYYKKFDSYPEFIYNNTKGKSKLLTTSKTFQKNSIKCDKIILVKYNPNTKTSLIKANPKNVLQTLIPDSWISPIDSNAKLFLEWIKHLNYYELSYNNNEEAVNKVSELFL